MKIQLFWLLAILTIQPAIAVAMHYTQSGFESGFWDRGSVVYGEIVSVEKNDGNGHAVLRLSILSTISGPLDAAKVGELSGRSLVRTGWDLGKTFAGKGGTRHSVCRNAKGRNVPGSTHQLAFHAGLRGDVRGKELRLAGRPKID